jgi:hypothetical protein
MDITKISGEELAKLMSDEYEKLLQIRLNILALKTELDRRDKMTRNDVDKD